LRISAMRDERYKRRPIPVGEEHQPTSRVSAKLMCLVAIDQMLLYQRDTVAWLLGHGSGDSQRTRAVVRV